VKFDWQGLHKDFIPGILYSEILSYQIFTHVAREGYSSRVTSMSQFARVNADVVRRWSYPLVPDVNLFCDSKFAYFHPGVYKEPNVKLAQSCSVGAHSLIGAGCSVGDKAQVCYIYVYIYTYVYLYLYIYIVG
jgi:translation initiation factor eIF-2B subunit epsilon